MDSKNVSLTAEMNAAHCSDVYSSQNECETTLAPKVIAPEHDPGMHNMLASFPNKICTSAGFRHKNLA